MKPASGLVTARRELTKGWLRYKWPLIGAGALLVLALIINVVLSQYAAWVARQDAVELRDAGTSYREGFEAGFASKIAEIERSLDVPALSTALRAGGPEAIASDLERVVRQNPSVIGARYVRPGETEPDQSSDPPLGYAALEMLRRAEQGQRVVPAVLFFGSDQQQIVWLHPLEDGKHIVGHLLIALEVGMIQSILDDVSGDGRHFYVEVEQPVAGKAPLSLAHVGDREQRQGAAALRRTLEGTPWRVALWSSLGAAGAGGLQAHAWEAFGVLALLLVAWTVLTTVRESRRSRPRPVYDGAAARARAGEEADDAVLARFDSPGAPSTVPTSGDGRGGITQGPPPLPEVEVEPVNAGGIIVEEEIMEDAGADVGEPPPAPPAASPAPAPPPVGAPGAEDRLPPASVFRAYDIRGVVGEGFGAVHFRDIARAIGSEALERGQQTVVVGRDGRLSSPELHEAVIAGLRESGRDVIDIGLVPTPVLYFATHYLNTGSGVMVTASHNPAEYNGLKIMLGGDTLFGEDIAALRTRLESGHLESGQGHLQEMDLLSEYIRRVSEDVPVALGNAFRLVLDCSNGAAGTVAPKLFRALGHDVIELYCDVDGSFPNHEPDTSDPANLVDLVAAVTGHQADLGFGFDGDGDRLAVVDGAGNIILPDRLMMLYARDILSRSPGSKIVYDVKCSNRLGVIISKLGGVPVMWKTGHSFLKRKLREEGAELAGDLSGHIFFQERWYGFDDAMYAAARLLEILMAMKQPPGEILVRLPTGVATPEIRVELPEGEHLAFMERFASSVEIPDASISTIDGVRADFADGWGLVRASNTTPALTLRFEAHNPEALARIQGQFKALILGVNPELDLPF